MNLEQRQALARQAYLKASQQLATSHLHSAPKQEANLIYFAAPLVARTLAALLARALVPADRQELPAGHVTAPQDIH